MESNSQATQTQKAADEKFCSSCGAVIKILAELCPKCGVRQRFEKKINKTTLLLLTFFLGGLGAHKFYLGKSGLGVLYLLFCWTFIPGIISFVEFIIFAATNEEELTKKYALKA
jgi:TM2 domain-containing membrane protein YozV